MTFKLEAVFRPSAVAVLGATASPDRVGFNLVDSLLNGGFEKVYPVHPSLSECAGVTCYPTLKSLPEPVDLVAIALNQYATVKVLEECKEAGARAVIVIAGGFREMGADGASLEQELVDHANRLGLLVVGPNTLGLLNNHHHFFLTFYPMHLPRGPVSFISQSGGTGLMLLNRAREAGLGISKWVGVGNRSILDFCDYLTYLRDDPDTGVIGIFIEGTERGRELVELAREVNKIKPVVFLKAGESAGAAASTLTHTGTMSGSPQVWRDVLHQCGLWLAKTPHEMVAVCQALVKSKVPAGKGVAVLTHTAGPGIILTEQLHARGCHLVELAGETIIKVQEVIGGVPAILRNPLDVAGLGFKAEVFGEAAEAMLQDPGVDLLVVIYCLHKNWRFPSLEIAALKKKYHKPIVAFYVSDLAGIAEEWDILAGAGIPLYTSPEETAAGVAALLSRSRAGGDENA